MQVDADIWSELFLYHLSPRWIGLLECVSKSLRKTGRDPRVWQRQAVLAWNGFYCSDVDGDFRAKADKFLAERRNCRVYEATNGYYSAEDMRWHTKTRTTVWGWSTWDCILSAMEVYGDGYKTIGEVTDDAKIITMHELDEDWGLDHMERREWVEDLKESFYEWSSESSEGSSADGSEDSETSDSELSDDLSNL